MKCFALRAKAATLLRFLPLHLLRADLLTSTRDHGCRKVVRFQEFREKLDGSCFASACARFRLVQALVI